MCVHRRPYPPRAAEDGGGRVSEAAVGALADRRVGNWGLGGGGVAGGWVRPRRVLICGVEPARDAVLVADPAKDVVKGILVGPRWNKAWNGASALSCMDNSPSKAGTKHPASIGRAS